MDRKKRKRVASETDEHCAEERTICVIHFAGKTGQGFTPLTEERLAKLKDIRERRLALPMDSKQRMTDICQLVPETVEKGQGYHRDCYKQFTSHITDRAPEPSCQPQLQRPARVPSDQSEKIIFKPNCIFCDKAGSKKVKKSGVWTTETTCKFEFGGGDHILDIAERREDFDLLRRIKGFDLFACEAQYHRSCAKSYTRDPSVWQSTSDRAVSRQAAMEAAHAKAFSHVCGIVDVDVLQKMAVTKLDQLRDIYVEKLRGTEFENDDYRSEKLKKKLVKHYDDKISFQPLRSDSSHFESYLIYNSRSDVGKAVMEAYLLGKADKTKDVALSLRSDVLKAHKDSEPVPWPPTAHDLESSNFTLPEDLEKFLIILFTGKQKRIVSFKKHQLVDSIGQDLCRAMTSGHWKLPKHILLCMTLRHLYRSAELTHLLNRFGHCENYSFSLELETALANVLHDESQILSKQIISPMVGGVFHSDFDNFDQNTSSGSIHTSHGIMLQEVGPLIDHDTEHFDAETEGTTPAIMEAEGEHTEKGTRTRERSLRLESASILPECYVTQKPNMPYNLRNRMYSDGESTLREMEQHNLLWTILRLHSANTRQQVPAWAGFVSLTGEKPLRTTTIDYYPVINCPITEYKAVQECLRYAEEATRQVGQQYTITTFDLGVCMKAYPLIWKFPEKYKNHIVMIGSFHAASAYLKMIGKKMDGSGLSDILLEAGLITSGSLTAVLARKQYNRAMICHKTTLEALERLLLQVYNYCLIICNQSCKRLFISVDQFS